MYAKFKLFFWTLIVSSLFSFIPFILIIKLISRPIERGLTVYLIIDVCSFAFLYLIVYLVYSHRKTRGGIDRVSIENNPE